MKTTCPEKQMCVPVILAVVCLFQYVACKATHAMDDMAKIEEYPAERLKRMCRRVRECNALGRSGDVLGQVEMLLDRDPWVRDRVYHELREETNLADLCPDAGFVGLDPWGKPEHIQKTVRALKQCLETSEKRVRHGRNIVRTPKVLKAIERRERDEHMLGCLIGMARHRLDYYGDKRAMYPLIALLNHGSIHTRAKALTGLMGVTETVHFWPKDGLKMGAVDPEVLERTKAKWLAWWRKHEATFIPRGIW